MDGYVQHANVGSRSKIEIDEEKSSFVVADGKITGTLEGDITQEYKGKTDQFSIQLNDVPFEGVGGGSGGNREIVKIAEGAMGGGDALDDGGYIKAFTSNYFFKDHKTLYELTGGRNIVALMFKTSDDDSATGPISVYGSSSVIHKDLRFCTLEEQQSLEGFMAFAIYTGRTDKTVQSIDIYAIVE